MKHLRRKLSELFQKGISFILKVKPDDKVLVVHHKDVDGLVSAVILLRTFERVGLKVTKVIASSNEEMGGVIKKIKNFDKTIILDIDICYLKKQLIKLEKDVLLIDHHPPRANLNTKRMVYINPRLEHPEVYQPVSYVIYKFLSEILILKDIEWLAALGTVGDYGFRDCKDLLKKWIDVKNIDLKNGGGLPKIPFWKNVKMLNGAIMELGFNKTLQILKEASSLGAVMKDREIKKSYKIFNKKLKELEKEFVKNAKTIEDVNLIISEIGSKHGALSSFFSTEFATKHPNKIIVLIRKIGRKNTVNARYQGIGVDLGKIMEHSTKGLNGGGGHLHAAGATILAKNKDIFKERLIRELKRVLA